MSEIGDKNVIGLEKTMPIRTAKIITRISTVFGACLAIPLSLTLAHFNTNNADQEGFTADDEEKICTDPAAYTSSDAVRDACDKAGLEPPEVG